MVKPIVNPLQVAVGPNLILSNPKPRGLTLKKPVPKPVLRLVHRAGRSALVNDAKNLSDFAPGQS